ncbi:MAG TPA: SDR family NAD(P)-dependent oxidoreductase [Allosphingosinicella sp.]|nr:SDR family NAD(P)-dependent oxidoreductase [Allosphingosinicella sp.]
MTRLKGQHALITGGGTGIGACIARALAAEGARLTLVGRRREKLEEVGSGNFDALVAPADVTNRDEVERVFGIARDAQGPITILVNNAGAGDSAPFARITDDAWRRTMAVNLDALLYGCQAALPDLLAAGSGRIVNIASTAGLKGYAYSAAYVAAKHGAVGLTRALALELAKTRVTVNAVCPGFADTDLAIDAASRIQRKTGRSETEARAELARFNPQGRLVTPEEVASAVLWLCLPESASITGQAIAVAGGEVM